MAKSGLEVTAGKLAAEYGFTDIGRRQWPWGSHMSQKQQLGVSSFLARSMVSLVVGLLYVAACACPAVKEKNRGLELINGLLVSLGGKPDAQGPEYIEAQGVEVLLAGWPPPRIIPWSANLLLLGG